LIVGILGTNKLQDTNALSLFFDMPRQVQSKVRNKSKVYGWPDALKWKGSVVKRVSLPVFLLTSWSVVIWILYSLVPESKQYISIKTLFIQIISLVLSLLLVFRTNTAYDRYWEGRRLWGTLIKDCRNLARFIWVGVTESDPNSVKEKIAALKLVLAYFIAVKNHLRLQRGIKDQNGNVRAELDALIPPKRQAQLVKLEHENLLDDMSNNGSGTIVQLFDDHVAPNLPVDISHLLSAYISEQRKKETIDVAQFGSMVAALSSMIEVLTNLERILTSPIPIAYNTHLKQALYIYLILLPLQLVAELGVWSIILTFLASFTLVGVESIGSEIENPFGTDENDLPLERFCDEMTTELNTLMKKPRVDLAEWDWFAMADVGMDAFMKSD